MSTANLHFLDARGKLALNRPWLTRTINSAVERVRVLADPGDLDIAVRPDLEVPGETGHAGQCLGAGQILLIVDPTNPALTRNRNGALQRSVSHEVYLSLRAEGPGHGATLGEALVSEGLALHFEAMAYGTRTCPRARNSKPSSSPRCARPSRPGTAEYSTARPGSRDPRGVPSAMPWATGSWARHCGRGGYRLSMRPPGRRRSS